MSNKTKNLEEKKKMNLKLFHSFKNRDPLPSGWLQKELGKQDSDLQKIEKRLKRLDLTHSIKFSTISNIEICCEGTENKFVPAKLSLFSNKWYIWKLQDNEIDTEKIFGKYKSEELKGLDMTVLKELPTKFQKVAINNHLRLTRTLSIEDQTVMVRGTYDPLTEIVLHSDPKLALIRSPNENIEIMLRVDETKTMSQFCFSFLRLVQRWNPKTVVLTNEKQEKEEKKEKEEMEEIEEESQLLNIDGFPKRAYIQVYDRQVKSEFDHIVKELRSHSIPVVTMTTPEFYYITPTKTDLVIGDFTWTRLAMKKLGLSMPEPPDYPDCLRYLLHRKIWQTTLGGVKKWISQNPGKKIFIKPMDEVKAFSGLVTSSEDFWVPYLLEQHPSSLTILSSEVVKMVTEYRVYCVNGSVKGVCHYKGPKELKLDLDVVNKAVKTLFDSEEGKDLTGCGIDFAVMEKPNTNENDQKEYVTCLIEVNDGYSIGHYEGVSTRDFTNLLIARWAKLMEKKN
ncbi:hypothetical protein M0813_22690 [Anaeramoeba flamelloides]|uniref:ATP-grasp domain-containing protein n=1 Tax=Anaeramoeba flamelloides TaxID=1746091 RepID=A0ABQ8YDD2_9EUKA|nr:hypothetical protein M0813_22690 [Anaeramoeba flamelloides]